MKNFKCFIIPLITVLLGIQSIKYSQTIDTIINNIDNEKFTNAELLANDLVKKEPNNSTACFYLGKLCLMNNKVDQARQYFEKGLQVNEKDMLNKAGLGIIFLLKGDQKNSSEYLDDAISDSKNDVNVLANIADLYIITGRKDLKTPIEFINEAFSMYPEKKKSSILNLKLGDMYYVLNDNSNAIQNYQNAVDYGEKAVKGHIGIARIYAKIRQFEISETNLNDALKIDPNFAVTYKELGELYYSLKKYDDAVNNYRKYLSLTESNNDNQLRFASFLFLAKNYKEAVEILKVIESDNQSNPTLYHILAYSYYNLENYADGLPAYEKFFVTEKPEEVSASDYSNYAELLSKSGNDSLAVLNFHKAIELEPENGEIHGILAATLFRQKKYSDAAREFSLKENFTKKNLSLREYFDMGQSYYFTKDYSNADSVFRKITVIKPDLALGHLWRAFANSSIDSTSELGMAKPHYEKFIELASPTPEKYKNNLIQAYSYLGYFYFLKKDSEEFKDIYKENYKINWDKVLELDPKNVQATEALKNLPLLK